MSRIAPLLGLAGASLAGLLATGIPLAIASDGAAHGTWRFRASAPMAPSSP